MQVRDNQQATSWFVGIFEGESCFKCKNETYQATETSNSDKDIVERCEEFLKNNYILFKTYTCPTYRKTNYKIVVSQQDCINLYTRIIDKVECRKTEFQRIMGASETECNLSIDLDWLIGIYEAEGSFILSKNYRNNLTPKIELDNTNERIISKIGLNLRALGLSWYTKDYDRGKKPFTKIIIQGVRRCKRFLRKTSDLWESNRNIARSELLLNYCERRLSLPKNSGYCSEDFSDFNLMHHLNG